jgi:hypothetical protein
MTTKERKDDYHKEEADLFACKHEIVLDTIIHEEIGMEYYEVCKKCGATEFDN